MCYIVKELRAASCVWKMQYKEKVTIILNKCVSSSLHIVLLTLSDAPVQQQQQDSVSLAGHVVLQHDRSEGAEGGERLQLHLLLLGGGPLPGRWAALRGSSRRPHQHQHSKQDSFLFIKLGEGNMESVQNVAFISTSLKQHWACDWPAEQLSPLTLRLTDSKASSSFSSLRYCSWASGCWPKGCDFSLEDEEGHFIIREGSPVCGANTKYV